MTAKLEWLKNSWPLLQTMLCWKAQNADAVLSIVDCPEYETVKSAISQSWYQAYRQKFRNKRKVEKRAYVEFVKQKETYFNRWSLAGEVGNDYERLKLILMDDFKSGLSEELKCFVGEKRIL